MELNVGYIKTPSGILKVIETILVVVCSSILWGGPALFGGGRNAMFGEGILVTALIVTPLLLISNLLGSTDMKKSIFEMVFNSLMFIFLLSAGSVAVDYFNGMRLPVDLDGIVEKSLALGSMCIITSFIYLGDAVCAVNLYRQ